MRLFPAGTGRWAKRRLMDLGALALLGFAGLLLAICITYDPTDPSLNRATDGPVHNALGLPGAYFADVFMQTLGVVAYLLPLLLLGWVWRLLRHQGIRQFWLRLAAVPAALFLLSLAVQAIPAPASWPVGSGLGGLAGFLFLGQLAALTGLGAGLVSLLAALLGLPALFYASASRFSEWRALGRGCARLVTGFSAGRRPEDSPAEPDLRRGALAATPRSAPAAPSVFDDEEEEGPRAPARDDERHEPVLVMERGAEVEDQAPPPAPAIPAGQTARKAGAKASRAEQRQLDLRRRGDYLPPPLDIMALPVAGRHDASDTRDALEKNARLLEGVLEDFGVKGKIVKVRPGPVVTRYELEPAPGTKTSRVIGLADDIARSMSALSVRVAVVPGSSVIGIELPNAKRETVFLGELLASDAYGESTVKLPLVLGKDIGGSPQIVDLARMPHLLIAGTTGSGKSVAINAMILSLMFKLPPEKCRFIMIDPKMLELSVYDGIPHLLAPVVTDPKKAVVALKWTVREMERPLPRHVDSSGCATSTATTPSASRRRAQEGRGPDAARADRLRPRHRPAGVRGAAARHDGRCPSSSSSSTRWRT